MGFSMFYQDGIGIMGKSVEQSAHPYEYGLRNPLNKQLAKFVLDCSDLLWCHIMGRVVRCIE